MVFVFDRAAMDRAARISGEGEYYAVVASNDNCRLGVGARCPDLAESTYFVEMSFQLCQNGSEFDIQALKRLAVILQSLRSLGYDICCEMELVICERTLLAEEIDEELITIRAIVGL